MDLSLIRSATSQELDYIKSVGLRNNWAPVFKVLDETGTVVLPQPRIPEGLRQSLYRRYTKKGTPYRSTHLPDDTVVIVIEKNDQASAV